MLPKIIRTGIHRYEGTGVRKTEMATQYRKAYVPVTLDVDKEGAILPRLIWTRRIPTRTQIIFFFVSICLNMEVAP